MKRLTFNLFLPAVAAACLSMTGCTEKEPAAESGSSADDTSSEASSSEAGSSEGSSGSTTTGTTDSGTTGTTDSGTSGTSATTSTTGSGFVQIDGGIEGGCIPGKLDDCSEGEKCSAYVMEPGYCCVDTNTCVPIIGDGAFGDECTRTEMNDDCGNGLFCMTKTSGSTGMGVCLQFCDVTNPTDCADKGLPSANCVSFNDGVLPLCEDPCDPLAQDCPDSTFGCYAVGDQGFTCTIPGFDEGLGNDGDECFTIQSCKPGLVCTDGTVVAGCNADTCCTQFCDLANGNGDCTDAMELCEPYFEAGTAPPGYGDVGVCAIPTN